MAHLFRDLSLGHSKRGTTATATTTTPPKALSIPTKPITAMATDLPSPLGQLSAQLTDSNLRLTAYEILVAACRTSTGKAMAFTSSSASSHLDSPTQHSNSPNGSLAFHRSLTSAAASKMKKALGLKSPGSGSKKRPGSGLVPGKPKRVMTVGELMRIQMGISDAMDSRVRRALLRISAAQVEGKACGLSCVIFLLWLQSLWIGAELKVSWVINFPWLLHLKDGLNVCNSPHWGSLITEELGLNLDKVELDMLGTCKKAGDALIQLYHNFITDFETKSNLLKLAHFTVIVSRHYPEMEAAISYLD